MSTELEVFRHMNDTEVEELMAELKDLRTNSDLMRKLLTTIEKINDLLKTKLIKCECNQTFDTKLNTKLNVLNNKYEELKYGLELNSKNKFTNNMIVVKANHQKQPIVDSVTEQHSDLMDDNEDDDRSDSETNTESNECIDKQIVTQMSRSVDKPNIIYINVDNIESINKSIEPTIECNASDVEEEAENEEQEEQYEYLCEFSDSKTGLLCQKKFMTRESLLNHVIRHSGQRPWFCEHNNCDYKAVQRSHLIGHMRKSHTGRFQFKCDWPGCDFKGPSRYNVKRHKIIHTGEKPYRCDWPGCQFRSPNNKIADHKRIHTGERPFACNWVGCEARFSRPFTLKNHERTHTGEKPFVCDYPNCHYRSTQQTPLATHKRKHHSLGNVASEEIIITDNVIINDE